MRSPSRFLAAAGLSLLVAAPAIAAVPAGAGPAASAQAPVAADPPNPTIPERYLNQRVRWSTCAFDKDIKKIYPKAPTTRCATVKVPMDWNAPDAHRDISVRISHSEAQGTSKGLMMSNPGGPGGAGLDVSAALAADKPRLFKQYDLLGFDPRGFGRSEPLRCLTTAGEVNALPTTPDHRERDSQTHRAELAEAELQADACASKPFGEFVSTQQTVYDMDFLRALMGARQTNFIGFSYGTWLGSWYADTYPDRVGRFVLDSNMDWTHTQWQNTNFDPFSFQRRRDAQLAPWIARHHDQIDGLGAKPEHVLSRYEAIRSEVVALAEAGKGAARGDNLDSLVASALYKNTGFISATLDILIHDEYVKAPGEPIPDLVKRGRARLAPALRSYESLADTLARYEMSEEAAGPAEPMVQARVAAEGERDDKVVDLGAIGTTVRCNDTEWNDDPSYYLRESDRMTKRYPFLGYLNGVSMCASWPHAPQDRTIDLVGSPRMLMITGEVDPATAYEGALRSHQETDATRLVSIDDEGQHGQYVGSYSACAERIGDRFVFGGEAPGTDTVCGTSPLPEDSAVYRVDGPVDGNEVPLPSIRSPYRPDEPNVLLERALDRANARMMVR